MGAEADCMEMVYRRRFMVRPRSPFISVLVVEHATDFLVETEEAELPFR